MDHTEAVRLQAVEKYVLGKLPKDEHAAYEEHYFDCAPCAEEIKATVAFMECVRQVAHEEARELAGARTFAPVASPVSASARGGRFGWLRPAFGAAFVALLLFVGYQNGVTIPSLKQASTRVAVGEVAKSFPIMRLESRGGGSADAKFLVGPRQDFDIDVEMPGNSASGYTCQILDGSGSVLNTFHVSEEEAKNTVRFNISGGSLRPGKYDFVVFQGSSPSGAGEAHRSFTVEFVQ